MDNFSLKNFLEKNFLYRKREKLSIVTILFIVFLNIMIVLSLFSFIDYQQKKLQNPNKLYPNICRTIISNNSLDNFKNYFYTQKFSALTNINEKCKVLVFEKLLAVQNEHNIKELIQKERILLTKQKSVLKELNYLRQNYNNVLYGDVSNNPIARYIIIDNVPLEKLKERYSYLSKLNTQINNKKYSLYKEFEESKSFRDFDLYIKKNEQYILSEYLKQNNLYNLKKDLIVLLTLFPCVVLCFILMRYYKRRCQYIYFLIFKLVIYVNVIPLFITLTFICSSLVPSEIVNKILQYNFPFYFYYVLLFVLVMLLGLITMKLQIKYQNDIRNFKKETISRIDSYYKNICNVCVTPVNYDTMNNCPVCDNELKIECPKCGRVTIKDLGTCVNCGANIDEHKAFTINQF